MSSKRGSSRLTQCLGLALSVCLLAGNAGLGLAADSGVLTGDVRVTVNPTNIKESLPVPGGMKKVTMALHDVDLQDALRALSQKGGFNVLIDESVEGNISVDLNNVTIQDALETLKSYGNLVYEVQGKNLVVAEANSDKGKALKKTATRVFKLHNANAKVLANFLNGTVFADRANSSGGGASASGASGAASGSASAGGSASGSGANGPVMADYNTNSLIVVGDPMDIKVVEEHLSALDQPRMMKTWRLSQANALDVATALYSSLFNEGQPGLSMGGSSSASSSGAANNSPSPLRVTAESITEGSGASQAAHAGGSSGGSGQTSVSNSMNLRTRIQATQTIQLSPTGPIVMPDTRMNTLTLLGTAEQIGMADTLIATLDRKVPQLVIEAALMEVSNDNTDQFGFSTGTSGGIFSASGNNQGGMLHTNSIGPAVGNKGENILRITKNSIRTISESYYQFNATLNKNKVKMLANPTVITASDNEAVVSIVDEILRSVSVTQGSFGGATAKTYNIGEAGIVLNILPKVGANKTVSMRIRPIVTSVLGEKKDLNGNLVTLLSKRESIAQNVQIKDGETFVLGGLIHSTNSKTVLSNPLLSQLPILGALARNTNDTKHRSELVVMITPHIINDESELSRGGPSAPGGMQPANLSSGQFNNDGMVPVSFSGTSQGTDSAIPPMMPAQAFNSATHGTDTAARDQAQPMRHPSGSLLPAEMLPSPHPKLAKPRTSSLPKGETKATFMPASTTSADTSDLSDEKIEAIMNKFKSP
jgi:type II secretory pathway component GspD/PulD (secretin)